MPKKNPEVLHWNAGSPLFCCGFLGLGFGGIKMVTGADGLYVPWLFWDKQTVPRSWGVLGDPTNKSCSENFTKEFYWYLGAAA